MGCPFWYGSRRAPIVWRGAPGSAPRTVATRAIEIDAPPSPIWPWLVQIGPGRAGAYTYDWIENLFGLNMHSADRVVPEWQQLSGGDVLHSQAGRPGRRVEILAPERVL